MKNTKKVLSVALAGALAFGSMGSAFAAGKLTEGIEDKNVVESVERLNSFGIINGFEDGKYHPEKMVTRAQFAKILVEALGLGDAVAQSTTSFEDVNSGHWASGYIAVATGQGLIKGYPDGTFQPEKEVSYAEAVTMLVRALGYKDEFLSGSWPSNYIGKAAELDITDGVKLTASSADRGAVAIMVDNTLDAKVIVQDSYGDENNYKVGDKTLLEEKLDIEKSEDAVRVIETNKVKDSLAKNEVKLDTAVDGETTFEVADGIDANSLLGKKGYVYINSSDEIVFFEESEDTVSFDEIKSVSATEVELKVADDKYKLAAGAKIYIDNKAKAIGDLAAGMYGKVVLNNDDEIEFIDAYTWDTDAGLVKEVDAEKERVTVYLKGQDEATKTVDFTDADSYQILLNDEEIELKDIKENDVLYVAEVEEDGDDVYRVFVVRNTVEGNASKLTKDNEIVIDGDEYQLEDTYTTYSLDNNDDIKDYADANIDKLDDFLGEKVKVVLDITGDVRHLVSDVEETSDEQYAVIHKVWSSSDDMVRLFTVDGEEVSYVYDDAEVYDETGAKITLADGTHKHMLAKYEINKDGEIEKLTVYTTTAAVTAIDEDDETITIAGSKYFVKDSTVMFEVDDDAAATTEDAELVKWEDIDDDATLTADAYYVLDGGEIEAIVFTDGFDTISTDYETGIVVDKYYDGDWKVEVELYDGEKETYTLDAKTTVEIGDVIEFKASGNEIKAANRSVLVDVSVLNNPSTFADYQAAANDGSYEYETNKNENLTVFANVYGKSGSIVELDSDGNMNNAPELIEKITDKTMIKELVLDSDGKFDEIKDADISDIFEGKQVYVVYKEDMKDIKVVYVVKK